MILLFDPQNANLLVRVLKIFVEMRDNMKSVTWKMTSKDVTDGLKQKIEMEQPINQNQKEEMSGDD